MSQQYVTLKNVDIDDYGFNESIKTLRTNIQFSGNNIRTIMFTSCFPDEGKSEVSFALAVSLAAIDKKVLVIDADIRKSVLASRYQLGSMVGGLSQYLSGQKRLDEIVFKTNIQSLDVVFAGRNCPNPAELLEGDLFAGMIDKLRAEYDYIIIDTPPTYSLADSSIVAKNCDGIVLVIESGSVSYHAEQKVKEQLLNTGCRILGVVLNKVDINDSTYYSRYGKYGYGSKTTTSLADMKSKDRADDDKSKK